MRRPLLGSLIEFLCNRFSPDEFLALMREHFNTEANSLLSTRVSPEQFFSHAVNALDQRGLISRAEFFRALELHRPRVINQIRELERVLLVVSIPDGSRPVAAARARAYAPATRSRVSAGNIRGRNIDLQVEDEGEIRVGDMEAAADVSLRITSTSGGFLALMSGLFARKARRRTPSS